MNVSIYEYLDFRAYARDYLAARKAAKRPLSLGTLSRRLPGLSKPHLSLIFAGKRSLTSQKIEPLGSALGLAGTALNYFEALARFNLAESPMEKNFFLEQMLATRPSHSGQALKLDEYRALSSWRCLAIRELMKLPDFSPSPADLSRRFKGRLTREQAREALALLVDTGLARKLEDGAYVASAELVRSTDELASELVRSYHKSCLDLGKRVIDEEPVEAREFASVTLLLTEEEFRAIKKKIKTLREEAAESAQSTTAKRKLFQLNVQLFPLTE